MGQAIAAAIKDAGRTVPKVARAIGHHPSWLTRIIRGERGISAEDIYLLAEELGTDPARFWSDPAVKSRLSTSGDVARLIGDLVPLRVIDQRGSASLRGGRLMDEVVYWPSGGEDIERLRRRYIPMIVAGDYLAPDVVDGDIVVIDTEREAEPGNPVVATVNGVLHVKRLWRKRGEWVLRSSEGDIPLDIRQVEGVIVSVARALVPELRNRPAMTPPVSQPVPRPPRTARQSGSPVYGGDEPAQRVVPAPAPEVDLGGLSEEEREIVMSVSAASRPIVAAAFRQRHARLHPGEVKAGRPTTTHLTPRRTRPPEV